MSARLEGILCPNIVPFNDDHSINEAELRRLVDWLIAQGIAGLYPNGSSGEFIRLGFEERLRVVEIVVDQTAGRVPVLAGASEGNIDLTLQACHHYARLGCDAVSLVGPYYYKVDGEGVEHYFREVARQSPIDILAYNIPQFANEIPLDALRRLAADCPRIIGTKDSSRDMPRFVSTLSKIKRERPDFAVLCGCEEFLFPALMMGADGGTIACSNVIPEAIVKIDNDCQNGRYDACRRVQLKIMDWIETMHAAGNFPQGFRLGAQLRGFRTGPPRQPFTPTEDKTLAEARESLACTLAECGYAEAAKHCREGASAPSRGCGEHGDARPGTDADAATVDRIVRRVLDGTGL